VADVEARMSTPTLMLVAGAASTPVEDFQALDERIGANGTAHEMYVYDGAPHSFFDRSFGDWHDVCNDAWRRMLDFTQVHAA
jgi:carboxymethylenebutenolidase